MVPPDGDARLYLFGAPRIERGGEPFEVDTRKATALLAYLAMEEGAHARDALVGLLWPEYGQKRARAALRRTLSALHVAREEGWLLVNRENVALGEVRVDVREFRALLARTREHDHPEAGVCAACLPPLAEAVSLYRGDFLAGFGLRDSFAFDDWQYFQAEGLRRELAGTLDRLASGHGARSEWDPAILYARRRLTLDPLHEPAHRALMHLYALSGQRAAALKQYRDCVRILGNELGVAPLDETTRLYRNIGEGTTPPLSPLDEGPDVPAPQPAAPRPAAGSSPLVGRDGEWEAIGEAVRSGGALVVVEGEAGVGKTRLVEEFLASLPGGGGSSFTVRCYAGETNLAYGPFVEILERVAESPAALADVPPRSLAEASRLAPALAEAFPDLPSPPPLDTSGARGRFFEGVSRVLFAALEASRGPGVLFVDDVQWADGASVDLLLYLARRLAGRGACVIVAWRDEEVPAGHPLRGMLREAQRAGIATVLRPGRLGRAEVAELVRARVGDDEGLWERMLEETEGLPFFVAEYLGAVARGEIGGSADGEWSLPGGARDLLEGRLEGVGETARQVLAAAAVIGRSFDFDAVREASGRSEEETVEALEELSAGGLVTETAGEAGPVYDFSHEKLRDLVYEETSLARRRLLHRRVAYLLAGRARGPEVGREAARISYHYHLAGGEAEAAGYARLAGDHARRLYANRDALVHYEQALALGHPEPAALHEAMGDLRTLLGEYGAALESYEAAAALDESTEEGMPAEIEHKLGNVYARQGEWELAAIHYDSALEAHERAESNGDAGALARLHADRSLLAHNRGDPAEASRSALAALDLAAGAGDARALAQAHNVLGVLGGEGAIPHLEESLRLAGGLGDPDVRVAALNNLSLARAAAGEISEALSLAEEALELCAISGDRHREAALRSNIADLLHALGREEESMQQMMRSVEIFAEVGGSAGLQPEVWKLVEW